LEYSTSYKVPKKTSLHIAQNRCMGMYLGINPEKSFKDVKDIF
jgi:hypothetical protein